MTSRHTEYMREWRAKNREHLNACQRRWYVNRNARDPEGERLKRKAAGVKHLYGLSLEEYSKHVSRPCGICGATDKPMVLDHCHTTGGVRGGLCRDCNCRFEWWLNNRRNIEKWGVK